MGEKDNNSDIKLPQRQEEFVSLFFASQTRILSFILSLIPNFSDGEDILQEVWNIMWRKFGQYERETDFTAWGKRIAYYLIMDYRRKQSLKHVIFNDDLFGIISEKASADVIQNDRRTEILSKCLRKLPAKDRELIKLRYFDNLKPKLIADNFNASINSIYKSLSYVHGKLLVCMKRSLGSIT